MRCVALIGSPFQLVSLFEAIHIGAVPARPTTIVQGAPADVAEVLALGRSLLAEVVSFSPSKLAELSAADCLVLGDAYSMAGQIAVVANRRPRATIILEDGAASLRSLRTLAFGDPGLVRAHDRRAPTRPLATAARHRLRARSADLSIVHSVDHPAGVRSALQARGTALIHHRFEWSRERAPMLALEADRLPRLVLGSSMADDGFIRPDDYLSWLSSSLAVPGSAYRPHRREPSSRLERLKDEGFSIIADRCPVELSALVRRIDKVSMLPSTPALTLPKVDPSIAVDCTAVPTHWWHPGTPAAMVELVGEIHRHSDRHE